MSQKRERGKYPPGWQNTTGIITEAFGQDIANKYNEMIRNMRMTVGHQRNAAQIEAQVQNVVGEMVNHAIGPRSPGARMRAFWDTLKRLVHDDVVDAFCDKRTSKLEEDYVDAFDQLYQDLLTAHTLIMHMASADAFKFCAEDLGVWPALESYLAGPDKRIGKLALGPNMQLPPIPDP